VEYKIAVLSDTEATLKLYEKYQIDTITKEDKRRWLCHDTIYP